MGNHKCIQKPKNSSVTCGVIRLRSSERSDCPQTSLGPLTCKKFYFMTEFPIRFHAIFQNSEYIRSKNVHSNFVTWAFHRVLDGFFALNSQLNDTPAGSQWAPIPVTTFGSCSCSQFSQLTFLCSAQCILCTQRRRSKCGFIAEFLVFVFNFACRSAIKFNRTVSCVNSAFN